MNGVINKVTTKDSEYLVMSKNKEDLQLFLSSNLEYFDNDSNPIITDISC